LQQAAVGSENGNNQLVLTNKTAKMQLNCYLTLQLIPSFTN